MPSLFRPIMIPISFAFALALTTPSFVLGFDNTRNDNVVAYWGQNSYGATYTSDKSQWQQTLSFYCQDNSINTFPIAFLNVAFGAGGLPSLDLSNICNINDNSVFGNSALSNCSFLASDIQTCQAKGKIVTISIGGATGDVGLSSDAQAKQFADTIWNLFLGGSNTTRPFGSAILDGVDLDLEGGTGSYWPTFVQQIRSHANGASKTYYITAAPQCPFPDAYIGNVINAVGFDAVYVQFYNNYCGLQSFSNPNAWNFDQWDNWAQTTSPNKNVKVYIGAPADSLAAGTGYVDANTLASIALQTRQQYSSFGGVMLWDASQAYENGNYAASIKSALSGSGASVPTVSSTPLSGTSSTPASPNSTPSSSATSASTQSSSTRTKTVNSPSSSPASGPCGAVAPWVANVAYKGGNQVTYAGHLWNAKWWSYDEVPGGAGGAWDDKGPCGLAQPGATQTASTGKSRPMCKLVVQQKFTF